MAGRDELAFLHANTQIPKLIGLARHAELTDDAGELVGARFFWQAVTGGRSYVIGGNSDRENFQETGSLSRYVTEQTCESCNTYNMLKLTRRLFAAEPQAAYFDYYERAHLNHILAHQRVARRRLRLHGAAHERQRARMVRAFRLFLVLRRHRHGKPRQARRFDLLAGGRHAVRQPVHSGDARLD